MTLRRSLLAVHRWTGLTIGLVVLLSALTGAGLAFRAQIDPVVSPAFAPAAPCAEPASLERLLAAGRAAHPGGSIDYVRLRGDMSPAWVRFSDKDTVYVDRCTAQAVMQQNRYAGLFGTIEWLHRGLFMANGGWLMGAGAVACLLLLVGLGVFTWWPRGRFWRGFVLNRRLKGAAMRITLHRTAGAWVAVMLGLSALTGVGNAFDTVKDGMLSLGATTPAEPPRSEPGAAGTVTTDMVWAAIQRRMPAPHEALIHLPRKPDEAIEAYVIAADAPHPNARSYLYLDAYSGAVLRYAPYEAAGWGYQTYYWMLTLHTGPGRGVGALVWQALLFAGAAGAVLLAYTGIGNYLRRRLRAAKQPRPVTAAAE